MTGYTEKKWRSWLIIGLLFFLFLYLIRSILLPFVIGILTAYFLDPAADRLEKAGLSRLMSTVVITVGFFSLVALSLVIVIPMVANQLSGLIETLPSYIMTFQERYATQLHELQMALSPEEMEKLKTSLSEVSGTVLSHLGSFVTGVFASGMAFFNILSLVMLTPMVAFFLLRDWDKIVVHLNRLIPLPYYDVVRAQIDQIDQTLSGFIRGQTNVCLLLGTFYAIGLSLAGLKFGLVIGFLTGFLVILPYVGFMVGFILGVSVAFFQFSDMSQVWTVVGIFVAGQVIEGNFVTPKLVGDKVGLHPLWIIFGMLAGAALFGFVGILIAVPVTAVIGVLIRFTVAQYTQSSLYRGNRPAGSVPLVVPRDDV